MREWIDLNADLGEGSPNDAALMKIITSANIACGGHAGDEETIRVAIERAQYHDVAIGAHPGFEDKENFGRVRLEISAEELNAQLKRQIERFQMVASRLNTSIEYVKLHGALANMTSESDELALAAYGAICELMPDVQILAISGTAQKRAAQQLELRNFDEGFADRAYTNEGQLASRTIEGAVLHDAEQVTAQISQLLDKGTVRAISGEEIELSAHSVCVHGDNEHAIRIAQAVRDTISAKGITLRSFAKQ